MKKAVFFLFSLAAISAANASAAGEKNSEELGPDRGPAYVIPIAGDIDPARVVFVRRSIGRAKENRARIVIFDIDTFGGRVDSALQIATLIGSLDPIPTIAHVTGGSQGTGVSWSAGALISFSADRIYMAPGTSIGAAAPVQLEADGSTLAASEKEVSAVRAQMAALAEKNGYPKIVAIAMVDRDVEVVSASLDGDWMLLAREELEEAKRKAAREGRAFETGPVVSAKGKLLSLTAGEMLQYGISSGTVSGLDALLAEVADPSVRVVREEESLSDAIVSLIASPAITMILILAALVALYIEITTPGFGVPGTIALICFAVLFAGNFLLGTVESLDLILFVVGVALLLIEVFLIPGFGVVGISGLALISLSLILAMQDFLFPRFDWEWDILKRNGLVVLGSVMGATLIMVLLANLVPRLSPFKRLALSSTLSASEGYRVQSDAEVSRLIGTKGVAVTALRPSGKADIGDKVLPVVADGEFVDAGTPVEVVEVSGNRIVVRGC